MESPGPLVTAARHSAGLSMHALAARADVAYSTVSRIEHGRMDPTFGMLSRLLAAAGQDLELTARESDGPYLAELADAWHRNPQGQDRPDWTRLRAFLDYLIQHPEHRGRATLRQPPPSGSAFVDTLLAGIAEKICDDAGIPRPTWVRRVPTLREQWFGGGTAMMRAAAKMATAPQLLRRNVIMTTDSLWRDPATIGMR